jgi:Alginate export
MTFIDREPRVHWDKESKMKRKRITATEAMFFVSCLVSVSFAAAQDNTLAEAVTSGEAHVALRFRYEHVNQDGFTENANAAPLRIRLNYQTGKWNHWSAFAEFDHIAEVFLTDYNSGSGTSPSRTQYPVVADPEGSDLNQLYLQYGPSDDWRLRIGREKIILDDQRFVGPVGWRQNEQTFDGLSLLVKSIPNTELFYSYIDNVNRIFGDGVPAGDHDVNTHLLNARIRLSDAWSITPYVYYIDNDDSPSFSTSTFGARFAGSVQAGEGKLSLLAEVATQSDAANNPVNYDADFIHLNILWAAKNGFALGASYESLGGDSNFAGMSFRTPLATLHPFQGWADQFLTTPDSGIDDVYLTIRYNVENWNLQAVLHDFSAEAGSGDFGTEFDLSAGRKLGDRYGLLLKAALFDADPAATSYVDTDKFWIMLTANY